VDPKPIDVTKKGAVGQATTKHTHTHTHRAPPMNRKQPVPRVQR
jgi:hypothetical protein